MGKTGYYDYSEIDSRNAVFNFIPGIRGLGKTYGAKKNAINRAIKRGSQFIYVRRYKEELQLSARTFFNDVKHEFPGYEFRTHGHYAQMRPIGNDDEPYVTIGYFIALSIAQSVKSVSYPEVKTIIYDEFIPEKGRQELPDEFNLFLNFYNTVDRYDDRVKVYFLANAITIMSCYFKELGVDPENIEEWQMVDNGFACVHIPESSEFRNSLEQSRFARFVKKREYAESAMENKFKDGSSALVEKKSDNALYAFTIEVGKKPISIWFDTDSRIYYAQSKQPKEIFTYVIAVADMRDGTMLMLPSDNRRRMLKAAFVRGMVRFDSARTRNNFYKVIN